MIRLIALDLDGTSLGFDGTISPGLTEAVASAEAQGIKVMLATGRMVASAELFRNALHISPGPIIAYNGASAVSMPEGDVWFRHPVDDAAAKALVKLALAYDILVQVYVGDELWVSRDSGRVRDYVKNNHVPVWVRSGDELLEWPEAPLKVLLQADPNVVDRFRAIAEEAMQRYPVRLFKSQRDYLEMVGDQVGKGHALTEVASRLTIPRQQVLAIGDNENDMDMLAWAGIGVAMGQSRDPVKAVADLITGSVDEGGAATAIRQLVLGQTGLDSLQRGGKPRIGE